MNQKQIPGAIPKEAIESTLYVVATPIGNLQDISARALDVLRSVDLIAAEDTRMTTRLLDHYGISTRLISLHEHNERERTQSLVSRMQGGESIAVVSDAGTPLVSDPGYLLVAGAIEAEIPVVPLPGASAVLAALMVSGLAVNRFTFEGFIPGKSSARRSGFEALVREPRTMIFFETARRITDCLRDMNAVFGSQRRVCVARELTKRFETCYRHSLGDMVDQGLPDAGEQRGEFVIVLAGADEQHQIESIDADIFRDLLAAMPLKKAVDLVVRITGERRNAVYERALSLRDQG